MRTEFYYASKCGGQLRACRWTPEGEVKAIVQFVHGIAEHIDRYDHFANFLNSLGILVVAEDHMGHGRSISEQMPQGFFVGGWDAAVEDTYRLLKDTIEQFPGVPYILYGHSMGSFIARTILAKYPDTGLAGAVISGTGWQPGAVLTAGIGVCRLVCRTIGERTPSPKLHGMIFGSYNKKVEHPRTASDWLTRDNRVVDLYEADPLCGFVPAAGLLRDMMLGIRYIQDPKNLDAMNKEIPVLFVAGGDDPVGAYGTGVRQAAEAFAEHGVKQVDVKIYPLCRHEMHNEINKEELFEDLKIWIEKVI